MQRLLVSCFVIVIGAVPPGLRADDEAFQSFFFDVCRTPTGALAERCAQTPAGAGDLSGNSESSLNPSQTLSSSDGALANARSQSREARERISRYREDGAARDGRVRLGPFSLLVNGRREWESLDRNPASDPERAYDADRHAFEIGIDRRFSDALVAGVLYAYEDGDLEFAGEAVGVNYTPVTSAGAIDRQSHALTLFGVWQIGAGSYLEASAGYLASDYRLQRAAVFQESTRTVPQTNLLTSADTDGRQYWGGLTLGADWAAGAAGYGLYAGLTYADSRVDGYREADLLDAGLAMTVASIERTDLTGHAGFRAQYAVGTDGAVWLPQIRFEYQEPLDDDAPTASSRFVEDAQANRLVLDGDRAEGFGSLAIGLSVILPNGWMSFVDVEGQVTGGEREFYRLTAGLRKEL